MVIFNNKQTVAGRIVEVAANRVDEITVFLKERVRLNDRIPSNDYRK